MNHIAIHHLVDSEKHLEKARALLTNPKVIELVDVAYAKIIEAGDLTSPDIAQEARREKIDPMM